MLDQGGFPDAKIMASGDLDEFKIRDLIQAGAAIDVFGVGTELATSGDAPSMGTIYKMVEIEEGGARRYTAKHSEEKHSIPGAKQIFRYPDHDLLSRSNECAGGAVALQQPVILQGNLIQQLPTVHQAREHARKMLEALPESIRGLEPDESFPVFHSAELDKLIGSTSR